MSAARRQFELFYGLHLCREPVAVPTKPPFHPPASHRLVTRDGIFYITRQQVTIMREPVGKRGPVIKNVLGCAAARLDRGLESTVISPVGQDLALYF